MDTICIQPDIETENLQQISEKYSGIMMKNYHCDKCNNKDSKIFGKIFPSISMLNEYFDDLNDLLIYISLKKIANKSLGCENCFIKYLVDLCSCSNQNSESSDVQSKGIVLQNNTSVYPNFIQKNIRNRILQAANRAKKANNEKLKSQCVSTNRKFENGVVWNDINQHSSKLQSQFSINPRFTKEHVNKDYSVERK